MLRTRTVATVCRSVVPTTSKLRTTSLRAAQRPYSSGSIHDNDPEVLEREKQRNLRNEQHGTSTPHKHAPGWNEHLASSSEAYTKADKSDMPISEMVEHTVEYVGKRHPKTMTETVVEKVSDIAESVKEAAAEATDTIVGPLAGAGKNASNSGEAGRNKGKKDK
ncbi:hypothetical protein M408DRAFT_326033 [Serendipita vermifera MAFF 305830]|uniref:Uncharacterized protein n=1 Tax=Serendipita vermifera MAFF 305830 TaxID=933852 RepID=A0A0C3BMC8_SERVB|nr:hypothetical protein M408DRAFT_326033 [Serendipita vermifera MAFF 305830]